MMNPKSKSRQQLGGYYPTPLIFAFGALVKSQVKYHH